MTTRHRAVAAIAIVLALLAVIVGTWAATDVAVGQAVVYLVYLGVAVILPGAVWWELVQRGISREGGRRRTSIAELVVGGAALGYAIEIASYAAARAIDAPRLYLLGSFCALALGALLLTRDRRGGKPGKPGGLGPFVALVAIMGWTAVWLGVQVLRWIPVRPGGITDPDDPFHLALIGELRHHFPAVYPYLADEPLAYQYFYHLHAAASTWTTGASSGEALFRLDPVILSLLTVLGASVLGFRLSGRRWVGVVAAALMTLVGAFDLSGLKQGEAAVEDRFLTSLVVHSPTQTFAFAIATPLLLIALDVVDGHTRLRLRVWSALLLLSVLMMGAKVTFLPMVLAASVATAALAVVMSRISRGRGYERVSRRALLLAGISAAAAVFVGIVIYQGQTRQIGFGPGQLAEFYAPRLQLGESAGELVLVSLSILVGVCLPAVGAIALLGRSHRGDPRVWTLLITGASGMGAALLLGHPGLSQRYFLSSAVLPLAVAGAWGLSVAVGPEVTRRRALGLTSLAIMAGAALWGVRRFAESRTVVIERADGRTDVKLGLPAVLNLPFLVLLLLVIVLALVVHHHSIGRAVRSPAILAVMSGLGLASGLAFTIGQAEPAESGPLELVPDEGVAALSWLADQSTSDSLSLTNAHCGPVKQTDVDTCDNRHFWMAAYSERRFLIEGWAYTGADDPWIDMTYPGSSAELVVHDRVFVEPDHPASTALLRERSIDYLVVDRSAEHDWTALMASEILRLVVPGTAYAVFAVAP